MIPTICGKKITCDEWTNNDQLVCCNWHSYHGLFMLNREVILFGGKGNAHLTLEEMNFLYSKSYTCSVTIILRCNASPKELYIWALGYVEYILFNKNIVNEWIHKHLILCHFASIDSPFNAVISYKISHFKGNSAKIT